ncbi:MAG TPA: glycosyltransferase, partial [Candidatus Babeliales bacterium]|nr:glycosyltransferase [Candidatus Babeliales bacterium]
MSKNLSRINALVLLLCGSMQLTGNTKQNDKQFVIVTASYNNARWYEWSLNSVASQTYPNWRMIYVDDCSPDGTGKLVEYYIEKNHLENK